MGGLGSSARAPSLAGPRPQFRSVCALGRNGHHDAEAMAAPCQLERLWPRNAGCPGHHFISNLMFGSKHQISRKTAPQCTISRTYANFSSDLKFGSERQIRWARAPFAHSERRMIGRTLTHAFGPSGKSGRATHSGPLIMFASCGEASSSVSIARAVLARLATWWFAPSDVRLLRWPNLDAEGFAAQGTAS
jgi:hypothetical protein